MSTDTPDAPRETEHEQNDNWAWSDSFTSFINSQIEGRSLKVCPGLRPICDVNLDIKDLSAVAESDSADFSLTDLPDDSPALNEFRDALKDDVDPSVIYGAIRDDGASDGLYNGFACQGDMFELPFKDNSFDTTVSDPPWRNLSADERRQLFEEIVRVTKPTGSILYNATWIPEDDHTNQYGLRARQQLDFWGGPSFAALYRRTARSVQELFDAHDYESVERYPEDGAFWSEAYPLEALSTDHNTDPKKVSGHKDHSHYCCPMCGCSQLGQFRNDFFEGDAGQYGTYMCLNCEYRMDASEIERLAEAIEATADRQDVAPNEVTEVEYTPGCIEHRFEALESGQRQKADPMTPELPWVPETRFRAATEDLPVAEFEDQYDDLSAGDIVDVLDIIAAIPSVVERTDGDPHELRDEELARRFKTIARAVRATSVRNVRASIPDQNGQTETTAKKTECTDGVPLEPAVSNTSQAHHSETGTPSAVAD
jgi:hypothetical protein